MNQRRGALTNPPGFPLSFYLPLLTEKEIIIISIAELISFHSGKATQYYHYIIWMWAHILYLYLCKSTPTCIMPLSCSFLCIFNNAHIRKVIWKWMERKFTEEQSLPDNRRWALARTGIANLGVGNPWLVEQFGSGVFTDRAVLKNISHRFCPLYR